MSRFRLQPRHEKNGTWRLNVPASISPTGKRQRLFFQQHWQALAAAKSFRTHYNEFGLSSVALSPSRRIESAECWQLLDEVCPPGVREAPPGAMREIILKAVHALKEASKSITLGELFDLYTEKAKRTGRTKGHLANIGYARKAFDFWIDTQASGNQAGKYRILFAEVFLRCAECSLVDFAIGPELRHQKGFA